MIHITRDAWRMMQMAAHHNSNDEISGFFRMTRDEEGDVVVDDILIPPQEVAGAAVSIGVEQRDWAMMTLAQRGEHPRNWGWWHSHVRMSPTPSGTDRNTLTDHAEQSADGWALGIIINQEEKVYCWAVYRSPINPDNFVEQELTVDIIDPPAPELEDKVAEMMKGVTHKVYVNRSAPKTIVPSGTRFTPKIALDDDDDDDVFTPEEIKDAEDAFISKDWDELTRRQRIIMLDQMEREYAVPGTYGGLDLGWGL